MRYGALRLLVVSALATMTVPAAPARPVSSRGTEPGAVYVHSFELPVSRLLSAPTRRLLEQPSEREAIQCKLGADPASRSLKRVREFRACLAAVERPRIQKMLQAFGVRVEQSEIGGVPVEIFRPLGGVSPANRRRVLINLHGGGFVVGDPAIEAIPISGMGRFEVVGVEYRMAPEYRFPAANEDVETVYRGLLHDYQPQDIGIYGCSAGGRLTAETIAWFQQRGVPEPGAIGIFSSGANWSVYGDSAYIGSAILGMNLVGSAAPWREAYFGKHPDRKNPVLAPRSSRRVMAAFPPTLLISGTRDFELSNAVSTDASLVELGVTTELHVWEGLGHCFFFDQRFPESRAADQVIVKFFGSHLKK